MTGDANGKLRGEGLYLGAQGLYAPAGWDAWGNEVQDHDTALL